MDRPAEPLPVAEAYRAALARRLAALDPALAGRLAPRLRATLLDAPPPPSPAPARPASPLAALLQDLGTRQAAPAAAGTQAPWARLSVQRELARACAAQPGQAGPLNSQALALRTLQRLQGLAPAYLDGLAAQLEALRWLEEARPRRR